MEINMTAEVRGGDMEEEYMEMYSLERLYTNVACRHDNHSIC